jgi:hypothetical protein
MGLAGGLASNGQLGTGAVGTVTSVTATNATIVVAGSGAAPTIGIGTGIPLASVTGAAGLASPAFTGTVTAAAIVAETGIKTTAITSGALAQPAFSTGTAQQLSTTRDFFAIVALTATTIAGTCAIALSPDNTTYTTVATLTPGVSAAVESLGFAVPVNWWLRLTFTNATVVVTNY